MTVTINKINKCLPDGYEIIRDRSSSYFYFLYPENVTWYDSCVYTNILSSYSLNEWISIFEDMKRENEREIKKNLTNNIIKLKGFEQ